jgi:hypothetical protein
VIADIALDYTEWAPPLTADTVLHDIQAHQAQSYQTPSKIIMWVHQWDYLVKQFPRPKAREVIEQANFYLKIAGRPPEPSHAGTLWGIKVEVRDPENHKP